MPLAATSPETASSTRYFTDDDPVFNTNTDRMALISRLFSYSDYLSQLSDVLQHHFRGIPDNRNVAAIISQVNGEVTAINSFNRAASEAMDRFDRAMGVK